ncbi:hypothetical protein C9374_014316 [Naegleria lovaniensis]|uniref:Protein-glucosylgalactosylhydroxylysine glucosidase n=1 Tax=Naegleria lovaniensis TaxID=51637 RepID=A0AA88KCP3_NAELO|nr:uncharacterized protein C9374_014316 [Naegleria lovaniensis]KAG2370705.1 hypothetical protein C9374_014316 [Naegleria lovaniensis]
MNESSFHQRGHQVPRADNSSYSSRQITTIMMNKKTLIFFIMMMMIFVLNFVEEEIQLVSSLNIPFNGISNDLKHFIQQEHQSFRYPNYNDNNNNNNNDDWKERMAQAQLLATPSEPNDPNYLPSISNGYIGTVIDSADVFMGGVYVGQQVILDQLIGFHSRRARIPSMMNIHVKLNESEMDGTVTLKGVGSALDMERAMYLRRFVGISTELEDLKVEQRYYAHRVFRSLLVHQLDVDNRNGRNNVQIGLMQVVTPPSKDISFSEVKCPISWPNIMCQVGELVELETPESERVKVAFVTSIISSSLPIQVKANSRSIFTHITAIRSTIDSVDPLLEAATDFMKGISMDPQELMNNHTREWAELWKSGIELGGNVSLAAMVNSTLYYMLSATRKDYHWGISPGGVATNSYNGLMFWDQECFVLPSLVYLYPELAHGLIEYRFERLQQALHHAQRYGYAGAMYPFQSGYSGREVDLIALFNELEQHITGDIAFALQLYWQLTKDLNWLSTRGYPIASEIAKFWASRVTRNTFGLYEIHRVVGPDEFGIGFPWYSGVDNNVFTNAVAQISLRFANKAARALGKQDTPLFDAIANNMTILFDEVNQIHPEYDGFPKGNIYFMEYVKQADVVLLGYPLMFPMPPHVRYNDIRYYEKYMWSEGPAMTYSMHTITYLDLKNYSLAGEAFRRSLLNIHPPFNIISETPDPYKHFLDMGSFNFLTGAGGFLQSVQNGYGGLKAYDDYLLLNPQPFTQLNVTTMKLRGVHYVGGKFDLWFDGTKATITVSQLPTHRSSFTIEDSFDLRSKLL